jgi:hypothetical protein
LARRATSGTDVSLGFLLKKHMLQRKKKFACLLVLLFSCRRRKDTFLFLGGCRSDRCRCPPQKQNWPSNKHNTTTILTLTLTFQEKANNCTMTSKDGRSKKSTTVHTGYDNLEDDLWSPTDQKEPDWAPEKKTSQKRVRISPTDKGKSLQRNNSFGTISQMSTGSFSQSEDFRSIFDEDKKTTSLYSKGTEEEEIYIVKQRYSYLSIFFSVAQTIVLIIMMASCGVAPLNVNPMVGPYPDALSEWGAKNAYNILQGGEWWRLITPILLHAGVIHLVCNVAVQLETGAFFEREWGSKKWLVIYLTSAVGSSILSVIVMPDSLSVGSSGAVMGLFGGKLAEVICRVCESDRSEQARIGHQVRKEQCAAVTCSVVVVGLFSFIPYGKPILRLRCSFCSLGLYWIFLILLELVITIRLQLTGRRI